MPSKTRAEVFWELFPDAPKYRFRQLEAAWFDVSYTRISDIAALPRAMRAVLDREISWLSLVPVAVLESARHDTYKAVVSLGDGARVETVLMKNTRDQWTACVSVQVGCAMACAFCATGTMGFSRNLLSDEIVDQYRMWTDFLKRHPKLSQRISNIVFMGMGEPLANYDNVQEALRLLLAYTDIGPTRITVSTVGLVPMLQKLLNDPKWPPVRLAVSLHSADEETRKRMMPSSYDGFLDRLAQWTEEYFQKFDSKRRHLTFEYVMLSKVNDTDKHAEALIRFARRVGKVRVNLIPYNWTGDVYHDSLPGDFAKFQKQLEDAGVVVMRRRTMGNDIAAACGQLVVERKAM